MNYIITHEAWIEASNEEEARQAYLELWQTGFFSKQDPDVEVEGKEVISLYSMDFCSQRSFVCVAVN